MAPLARRRGAGEAVQGQVCPERAPSIVSLKCRLKGEPRVPRGGRAALDPAVA
ncbi:hypothetical protein JL2886_03004 [Phaeobacter gallaeciensis]|uniref:Uncharacterized protein n=1 Tax=Phaeobacter gallaeciensis TaxID=60890 RepID=A0A1B0ZUT4_9RHOB|nr:hypothetical protein JL2886_03004 [Phaeobacter gallaeciensis]